MSLYSLGQTTYDLVDAMNKEADKHLPEKLSGIVKTHAMLAVGSALIPVPGADLLAGAANIWAMYVRINDELGISFEENILKSISAGLMTNIGGVFAGALVIGTGLKFIPGLGTLAGYALVLGTIYGITLASAIIYMRALTYMANRKAGEDFCASDLEEAMKHETPSASGIKQMVKENTPSKKEMKDIIKEARKK